MGAPVSDALVLVGATGFANTLLEPIWNRSFVESVEITMAERFGMEGRGAFYEEAWRVVEPALDPKLPLFE